MGLHQPLPKTQLQGLLAKWHPLTPGFLTAPEQQQAPGSHLLLPAQAEPGRAALEPPSPQPGRQHLLQLVLGRVWRQEGDAGAQVGIPGSLFFF